MDIRSVLLSSAENIKTNPEANFLHLASLLFMSMYHVPLTTEETNILTVGTNGLRAWLAQLPAEANFVITYFMVDPNSGKKVVRFQQPMKDEHSLRLEFRIPYNRSNSADDDPLNIREPYERKAKEQEKVEADEEKFRLSCRQLCGLVFSQKLETTTLKNNFGVDSKKLAEIILEVLEQKEYSDLIFKAVVRKLGPFSPRKEIDIELDGIRRKFLTILCVLNDKNKLGIDERIKIASKGIRENKTNEIEVSTQYEVEILKEQGFNAVLHIENRSSDFQIENVEV